MLAEPSGKRRLPLHPHRRQILEDLGIEVWRQRHRGAAAQAREAKPHLEEPLPRRRAAPKAGAHRRPAEVGAHGQPAGPGTEPQRRPLVAATPTDEAFTLIATCADGALVATGAFANRKQAALAGDIARCAGRDWTASVKQVRFDWPLPGITGKADAALGAFLEKQMQDFAAPRPLVTASMAEKIPPGAFDFMAIPDLEQLEDPQAKRQLWRQLQG